MKECLYGWYPPARDVWKTRRDEPDTYVKECLYKYRNTRFSSRPPTTRRTPFATSESAAPVASVCRSTTPVPDDCVNAGSPCSQTTLVDIGTALHRDGGKGCSSGGGAAAAVGRSPSKKRWADRLAETAYTVYPGSTSAGPSTTQEKTRRPELSQKERQAESSPATGTLLEEKASPANANNDEIVEARLDQSRSTHHTTSDHHQVEMTERCRSEAANRPPRPTVTKRAVKSAMPSHGRLASSADRPSDEVGNRQTHRRPQAPTPCVATKETLGVEFPLDYDEQLKKYG